MIEDKILIVGYGVVGGNLEDELYAFDPDIFDKFKPEYNTVRHQRYDIAFICVDTPCTDTYDCDISEVRNANNEHDADVYVIKSTVLPGTTDMLAKETGKHIVFSPEFYGQLHTARISISTIHYLGARKNPARKSSRYCRRYTMAGTSF